MLLSRGAARLREISSRSRSIKHPGTPAISLCHVPRLRCHAQAQAAQPAPDSSPDQRATSPGMPPGKQCSLPAEPGSTQAALDSLATAASSDAQAPEGQLASLFEGLLGASTLPHLTPGQLCDMLSSLERLNGALQPSCEWMDSLLDAVAAAVPMLSTRQLSAALWSLSNLELQQGKPAVRCLAAALDATTANLQDFYGPDFAMLVCALGSLGAQPPAEWTAGLLEEVEYQLIESSGDLSALDLARLVSGLADLLNNSSSSSSSGSTQQASGDGGSPQLSSRARDALMKLVYGRTRTIEEKGAVDFALAKLDSQGKRSMHYDPRWTHEELKWLPRRERDKRRIIKETWQRTQWGGWS